MKNENTVQKAELISIIRGYKKKRTIKKENKVDFTVSPCDSNKKILIRAISQPESNSGHIGVNTIREFDEFLKKNRYNKGIIVGNKFTNSAKKELKAAGIELAFGSLSSKFTMKKLHSTITDYVEKLCKTICGKLPEKESDCKGIVDGKYKCQVRLVSDNADFHNKKMWKDFLTRDLTRLIEIEHNI